MNAFIRALCLVLFTLSILALFSGCSVSSDASLAGTLIYIVSALFLCVIILAGFLLSKSRSTKKRLEKLVEERTRELALRHTMFTTLVDSIPDLIYTKDRNSRYMHANKAFLEYYGKSMSELYGKTDNEALGVPREIADYYLELDRKVMNGNNTFTIEEEKLGVGGEVRLFELAKMPLILDSETVGIAGIAHDITKRKETEQMIAANYEDANKARAEAELANQTKSVFLANMSHEIRTPMNAILGVTEILIQHENLPAEIDEGLNKIYSSCDMLLGIINDILDFSKIEAGKMDILPAQYKVASLINDSVHLNMMRIGGKPIEFVLEVDEDIPVDLIGDELRIKQILNNLLSNAFKYTDEGKVTLSIKSERLKQGVMFTFSVQDCGRGMSEEQLSKLFEEYTRFESEDKTVEGTGLGLSITYRLIKLMSGEILVESELGKGSLFTVSLPQLTVDDRVLGNELAENLSQFKVKHMTHKEMTQIKREPMPYGKVLIVDDVETNLYVAMGLMKLYRLKIETLMSGREAIEMIKSGNEYDIIFMDHMMPEMDGIEATKQLRELGYIKPVVALTANAVAGQADMFLQSGFDAFLSKPIDIRQLDTILNKLIRDKQPREVIEEARRRQSGAEEKTDDTKKLLSESFLRDAEKAIALLEKLTLENGWSKNEKNLRSFTVTVHGMKSSLLHIGEKELSEKALGLEMRSRAGDIVNLTEDSAEFVNNLKSVRERVKESLEDREAAELDVETLRGKLLRIKELCSEYDRKGIFDELAETGGVSGETERVLDAIKEHVLHSDFEAAEIEAADYAELLASSPLKRTRFENVKADGLDIIKGLERYNGDERIYIKILRSYISSVRSLFGKLETASEEKLSEYKIAVHGVKGASYDIFAERIGKTAETLEKAAAAGNYTYVTEHNPPFLETLRSFLTELDALVTNVGDDNSKPAKPKPDSKVLLKLADACKRYDMDGADAAMEEIEKYRYEADDGLSDWLRDNIDMMNFTQIAERLSEIS